MTTRVLCIILLFIYCFHTSSCVAIRQPKSWRHRQLISKMEPTKPFIEINLQKSIIWLPLPIIMWEVSTTKGYLLDIDFHTKNREYKQLDSVSYRIQKSDKQVLAAGILPIINGYISKRSYSPDVYRAQCMTQPLILLGNQHQELTGTFVIYATDINNQKVLIPIEDINLHYFKGRIISFF